MSPDGGFGTRTVGSWPMNERFASMIGQTRFTTMSGLSRSESNLSGSALGGVDLNEPSRVRSSKEPPHASSISSYRDSLVPCLLFNVSFKESTSSTFICTPYSLRGWLLAPTRLSSVYPRSPRNPTRTDAPLAHRVQTLGSDTAKAKRSTLRLALWCESYDSLRWLRTLPTSLSYPQAF